MIGGEATVTEGVLGVSCHAHVKTAPKRQVAAAHSTQEVPEAQQGEAGEKVQMPEEPGSDAPTHSLLPSVTLQSVH